MPDPIPPTTADSLPPTAEFKPNIYPIMYWALAFGAAAGVLLFVIYLLSQFIGLAWFPVFMAGLIWGGYRNYQKQKKEWATAVGTTPTAGSPMAEFRQAASDIAAASRELLQQEAPVETEVPPATEPDEAAPPLENNEEQPPLPPNQSGTSNLS
ncbi:MAG TPA: hypothetical protein VJB68_00460 [Methylophilaceae bacterium]|nr:hypothetical protein [Methylophilaceae bacterium]